MKKNVFTLLLIAGLANLVAAQKSKVTCTAQESLKLISHISSADLDDDVYTISVNIFDSAEKLAEIGTYGISEKIYINGRNANVDIWMRYDKSDEDASEPYITVPIDIGGLIESNANHIIESGNRLKIDFFDKKNDEALIGTADVKFDVPGYGEPTSEFCGELYKYRATDEKTLATLHTIFNAVYDHNGIEEVLMRRDWTVDGESEESNTFMVLFKNNESYYVLNYNVGYVEENGEILAKPRVKIYNGLSTPKPVAEACVKALKTSLK